MSSMIRLGTLSRRYLGRNFNAVRMGHGHHKPYMPPFGRQAPPTSKLPEEVELVWDDSVAPETCIDFDVPHVPLSQALMSLGCALGFIGGLLGLIAWSDPVGNNPVATRDAVIPFNGLKYELGLAEKEEGEDEAEY